MRAVASKSDVLLVERLTAENSFAVRHRVVVVAMIKQSSYANNISGICIQSLNSAASN